MRLGIFADFAVPMKAEIDLYKSVGISDIYLGVTTDRSAFKINATQDSWLKACALIREQGMTPHIMLWAVATKAFMEKALETMIKWKTLSDFETILLDAEGTWHKATQSSRDAAVGVLKTFKDIPVGVTGLDTLHPTVIPIVDQCAYVIPQAYSFWKPGAEDHWSHSAHTFPGPQQRRAYQSWCVARPKKPFAMGLACYWGDRPQQGVAPAVSDIQSMRYAMIETVAIWHEIQVPSADDPFLGVTYWSGKHLIGTTDERRARQRFLKMVSTA